MSFFVARTQDHLSTKSPLAPHSERHASWLRRRRRRRGRSKHPIGPRTTNVTAPQAATTTTTGDCRLSDHDHTNDWRHHLCLMNGHTRQTADGVAQVHFMPRPSYNFHVGRPHDSRASTTATTTTIITSNKLSCGGGPSELVVVAAAAHDLLANDSARS